MDRVQRTPDTVGGIEIVPSRIRSTSPLHEPRPLTAAERQWFRESAKRAREAKAAAERGEGQEPVHPINHPALDPYDLMPQIDSISLRSISLFSGGGGLDLGFERAGFEHTASYEIMEDAAATLVKARPDWEVFGGESGDVRGVNWRQWRRKVDVLHGGPPCQPFSHAGRQRGALDPRDMWPEFVRATLEIMPAAFVGENVSALADSKFSDYVAQSIVGPLMGKYTVMPLTLLHAADYGVPQVRRRVFFVGFRSRAIAKRYRPPSATHNRPGAVPVSGLAQGMGVRQALGLPNIGYDALSPTIRSTLNGPRNTTSILNSVSARKKFEELEIWPNGVASTRELAHRFVAQNRHFRLSVPDVALIQGFPDDWPFMGATYRVLGQIGNAVPPPLGYRVARAVAAALVGSD